MFENYILMITHCFDLLRVHNSCIIELCSCCIIKIQTRNDVIYMFNNYAKLSSTRYSFLTNENANHEMSIIELMIEQRFATNFDDIYTMHVYRDNTRNYHYVVDVAFELHTNEFVIDDDNDKYEIIHTYDMRVNVDISSNEIDYDEICNTIDFVKFDVIHRNAYTTREYEL